MDDPGPYPREGTKAPAFELVSDSGEMVRLQDLRGKKVVLFFYPEDDTPGCTTEACGFRDLSREFRERGAVVLGVSKDDTESHVRFKSKYRLPFPLLTDPDGKMLERYGVWQEKSLFGNKHWGIARTTFLINENGAIRRVFPRVHVERHAEEVLSAL